jgi:hypothetical protein
MYCAKTTTQEERKDIISKIFVRKTGGLKFDSEIDDETPMTRLLTNIDPNFDAATARRNAATGNWLTLHLLIMIKTSLHCCCCCI